MTEVVGGAVTAGSIEMAGKRRKHTAGGAATTKDAADCMMLIMSRGHALYDLALFPVDILRDSIIKSKLRLPYRTDNGN